LAYFFLKIKQGEVENEVVLEAKSNSDWCREKMVMVRDLVAC